MGLATKGKKEIIWPFWQFKIFKGKIKRENRTSVGFVNVKDHQTYDMEVWKKHKTYKKIQKCVEFRKL